MLIKVLGPGCANCTRLEATVKEVVAETSGDDLVEKVTDIGQIMAYGVMSTPGLVVDGQVVCTGRVPSKDEVRSWVADARSASDG